MDDEDPVPGGGRPEGIWDIFKVLVQEVLLFGSET